MSHFLKVRTPCSDKNILRRALQKRLGIEVLGENEKVAGFNSALIIGRRSGGENVVGLALLVDGTFSLVGDPYYATQDRVRAIYGRTEEFGRELITAYLVEQELLKLEEQGYTLQQEEVQQDGKVYLYAEI